MPARRSPRVLRLVPGGQRRRRCPNCQVLEQRIAKLEGLGVAGLCTALGVLAAYPGACGISAADVWRSAERLGLRARVERELGKG